MTTYRNPGKEDGGGRIEDGKCGLLVKYQGNMKIFEDRHPFATLLELPFDNLILYITSRL